MQTDEHFPDRLTVLVPHGLKRELDAAARAAPDDERVRAQDFVARGDGALADEAAPQGGAAGSSRLAHGIDPRVAAEIEAARARGLARRSRGQKREREI
jgi:hypothetical protein